MLDFGKHTAFILASYGVTGIGILGLIAFSYLRGKK